MNRNLADQRIGAQILALLGFILVGLVLVAIATAIVVFSTNPTFSASALENLDFTNPDNIDLLRTILPMQTILLFGVPASTFAYFAYRNSNQYIGMRPVANVSHIGLGILAIVCSLYFVGLLAQWNKMIPMPQSWISTEKDYAVLTKSLLTMHTLNQLFYTILIIGFLPALCEEFLFRGVIQNMMIQQFTQKYAMVAIIITGIIFGLIHGQMQTILPRIFLGILLGCLYYWSNSIWVSIIAHFVNNSLQVVVAYLASQNLISGDIIDDDAIIPIKYGLLSAGICIALLFIIYKSRQAYQIFVTNIDIETKQEIQL